MTNRPMWTLTEAVQNTTASRSTIRRYHEAGRFPAAFKDSKNQWRFPMEDLLAAGIELRRNTPTEQAQDVPAEQPATLTPAPAPDDEARARVIELERELAVERERVAGLQQLVAAKSEGNSDLRMALRIIEAPKPVQPAPAPVAAPAQPERAPFALGPGAGSTRYTPQPQRKGWFARLMGE